MHALLSPTGYPSSPFEAPTFDLKFHWHRRFDNEARSRWLRDQLAEVFREDPTLPQPTPLAAGPRTRSGSRRDRRSV